MTLALRYLAHSEIGLVRRNNQDSAYTSPTMLMVADGMGGAAAGDLASAIAIRELQEADGPLTGESMLTAIDAAIAKASRSISDLIDDDPALDGMGSTVCGFMFDGNQIGLANIGDSRAYRYRDGVLTRLTRDHSWVQTLVDEGRITEAEALEHPHRSLILRVINGSTQHLPDLELVDVQVGDRLLVCSDGLCGMVTDAVIASEMDGDLPKVLESLIAVAHAEGGLDNITIILADVVEGEPSGTPEVLGAAAVIDPDDISENTVALPAGQLVEVAPDPVAGETARYAPTTKHRLRTSLTVLLAILLPLGLIGGAGYGWYHYTQGQYYLGANAEQVAIYQGIPEPVFNLPLSKVIQDDQTRVADLPGYYQEQVRAKALTAGSLTAAQRILDTLRVKAEQCIKQRSGWHSPSPSPSPTPPASQTPSGRPSGSASPTAKPGATPSAPTSIASPQPTDTSTPAAPTEC
ncbi:protein phosphatase [Propionicimonas paludicola]|uniref:Protein phosphatase n=1 Tax=Propionicimonas paludicola TaxID=185243 RepID=A0A2A9CWF2_9ACTN|nr:protein phosphatase 2C domain-containing protein [Propionicimonas paludicola]PFG17960.1 protein phosphatase [Propionicimonas paludicola]